MSHGMRQKNVDLFCVSLLSVIKFSSISAGLGQSWVPLNNWFLNILWRVCNDGWQGSYLIQSTSSLLKAGNLQNYLGEQMQLSWGSRGERNIRNPKCACTNPSDAHRSASEVLCDPLAFWTIWVFVLHLCLLPRCSWGCNKWKSSKIDSVLQACAAWY